MGYSNFFISSRYEKIFSMYCSHLTFLKHESFHNSEGSWCGWVWHIAVGKYRYFLRCLYIVTARKHEKNNTLLLKNFLKKKSSAKRLLTIFNVAWYAWRCFIPHTCGLVVSSISLLAPTTFLCLRQLLFTSCQDCHSYGITARHAALQIPSSLPLVLCFLE